MSRFKTLVFLFSTLFSMSLLAYDQCDHFYGANRKMSQPVQLWGNVLHRHRVRPQKFPKSMIMVSDGPSGQMPQTDFWKILYPYTPNKGNYVFGNMETRTINQATSKECFLYSYLTALEGSYANRTGESKTLRFRVEYLLAKKFEHVISDLIEQYSDPFHFKLEGGELPHALELVQRHGLVPEDIWKPLILADGSDGKNGWDFEAIYKTIKSETDIARNNLIRNPHHYFPKTLTDVKKDIFETALGRYVGVMPKPFTYDGIKHTPESFGRMYGQNTKTPVEVKYIHGLYPYSDYQRTKLLADFLVNLTPTSPRPYFTPQPLGEILNDIKQALIAGKSINIDINGTIENFGHSLAITDIETTPWGETVAIKVKNTYRPEWGYGWFGGYVWISPLEFSKIMRRVWIVDIN